MVNIPTNYKMGSGLAATIMGQQAGLEAEQQGLANLYKAGQVPTQMLEGAKAMDLLNNPEYMKATQQWQTTAAQGRVSEEQSKKAYNDLTLLTTQLQAYNGDINKQRSILMESFQKNGVPVDSPMAQTLLQKPLENTMVARDQVAATLSKTPTHMGEMEKQTLIGQQHMDVAKLNKEAQLEAARIRGAGGGIGKYEFNTNKILMDAANGDPQAQQTVNLMAQMRGYAQSGGITIDPATGQMVTKGSTMSLPYPDAGLPKQEQTGSAGGGSYNYVPGQGLQPVGGAAPAQRKPPVAGRQAATAPAQDYSAPYIKQGGGVVDPSTGKTYSYDEYVSSRLAQQYPYSDLKVK